MGKNRFMFLELGKVMTNPDVKSVTFKDLESVLPPEDLQSPDVQQFFCIVETLRTNLDRSLKDPLHAKGMKKVLDAILEVSQNPIARMLRPIVMRIEMTLNENENKKKQEPMAA